MCLSQLLIFNYCCLLFTQLLYSAKSLKDVPKQKQKSLNVKEKSKPCVAYKFWNRTSLVCCVGKFCFEILWFWREEKRREEHKNVNVWCFWYKRSVCHVIYAMNMIFEVFCLSNTGWHKQNHTVGSIIFMKKKNASIRQGRCTSLWASIYILLSSV